jgi:biotin carboxylase
MGGPDSDRELRRSALVLDGGGAQSVVLVRVLGALGWDVLCESGTRASRSRWATATVDLPRLGGPSADADAYVQHLRDICARWNVGIVAPSSDLSLGYCWQAALEDDTIAGARILGADRHTAEVFTDKAAGIEAARRHGFPVPETYGGDTANDVVGAAQRIGFPCVVKPRRSFLRIGGVRRQVRHTYVRNAGEAYAAVRALTTDDGVLPLAQQYVLGRACSVTAVIHDGAVLASSARETLSFYPLEGGTSVWKRTIPDSTPGVREGLALMRGWGLEGLAEVEYVLTSAGPRFMELGPRMHGWIPLAEVSSPGLLATAISTTLGEDVPPLAPYRTNIEMRWVGGELQRLRDALEPSSRLPRTVSRLGVLRTMWPPWRPAMRYDGIDLSDLGPVLPRPFRYLVAARNGSVARIAENEAPLTKRQKGPKVPSAG